MKEKTKHDELLAETPARQQADGGATVPVDRQARIQQRAYEIWLGRGGGDGFAYDDWLQAEAEINAIETFRKLVGAVGQGFLRWGGEYSPFDAFHKLPNPCPSCGQSNLYCCFSGPLGGGSSITEHYLHVCLESCGAIDSRDTWYGYDGSAWADCVCLICGYHYGDRKDEWRIHDFGTKVYDDLTTSELQELLTNCYPLTKRKIRKAIESWDSKRD